MPSNVTEWAAAVAAIAIVAAAAINAVQTFRSRRMTQAGDDSQARTLRLVQEERDELAARNKSLEAQVVELKADMRRLSGELDAIRSQLVRIPEATQLGAKLDLVLDELKTMNAHLTIGPGALLSLEARGAKP